MTQRSIQFIVFILMSGSIALIVLWFTVWNKGYLELTGATDYLIKVSGYRQDFSCSTDPCFLELRPDYYTLEISKEGYFNIDLQIDLRRFKTIHLPMNFVFKPVYETIKTSSLPITLDAKLPNSLVKYLPMVVELGVNKYLYYLKDTQRFMIWEKGQNTILTPFRAQISFSLLVSSDKRHCLIIGLPETYLLDTQTGQKNKIAGFMTKIGLWDEKNTQILLVDTEDNLWRLDVRSGELKRLKINDQAFTWFSTEQLIISTNEGLAYFDLSTGNITLFMRKASAQSWAPHNLYLDQNKKVLFFINQGQNYRLKFRE